MQTKQKPNVASLSKRVIMMMTITCFSNIDLLICHI